MGPPLESRSVSVPVQTHGTVPLSVDEIQQINVFVDQLLAEFKAHEARHQPHSNQWQYVIRPHVKPEKALDGTVIFYRFNCAGFVVEAHAYIDIHLLVTQEGQLPPVSLETLIRAYPDNERALRNVRIRERYDLPGDGPWPVVLAGYVLNALTRHESEIRAGPYAPRPGDEFFPSQRQSP